LVDAENFDLSGQSVDTERPSVSILAGTAKNRTAVTLPLHPELVAELRAIKPLNGCRNDKVVLIGRMLAGMWKMKSDLKRAGIRFIENGRRADLHALRHTFSTNIVKTNAPPRVAMEAMRHSDLRLTMKVYTDANMLPVGDFFPLLPRFLT
jgi:integrase